MMYSTALCIKLQIPSVYESMRFSVSAIIPVTAKTLKENKA